MPALFDIQSISCHSRYNIICNCGTVLSITQILRIFHFRGNSTVIRCLCPFFDDLDEGGLELKQTYNIIVAAIISFVVGIFDGFAFVYLVFGNLTIVPTIMEGDLNDLKTAWENPKYSFIHAPPSSTPYTMDVHSVYAEMARMTFMNATPSMPSIRAADGAEWLTQTKYDAMELSGANPLSQVALFQ